MDMIQVRCKATNIMEKNYLIQIKIWWIYRCTVAVLILMLMLI